MKKLLLVLFLILNIYTYSQKQNFDFVASYNLDYTIYKQKNKEQFLLFMNSKEKKSYYTSTNRYVLDSLKKSGRIAGDDAMGQMKYDTAFDECVINNLGSLTVVENIVGNNYKYVENPQIKWKITSEKKQVVYATLRKAEAEIFGRKWIAWFNEEIPLNFGPYKFNGLPGLIYLLYDEKQEFFFTIEQFKRKARTVEVKNASKLKPISKSKINDIRFNTKVYGTTSVIEFDTAKEREDWINKAKERYKNSPRLDLEK